MAYAAIVDVRTIALIMITPASITVIVEEFVYPVTSVILSTSLQALLVVSTDIIEINLAKRRVF